MVCDGLAALQLAMVIVWIIVNIMKAGVAAWAAGTSRTRCWKR